MKRLPSTLWCRRCLRWLLLVPVFCLSITAAHAQCCPPDIDALEVTKKAYQLEGTLDSNAPLLPSANFCLPYADTLPQPDAPRYVHLIPFQISTNDIIVVHTPTTDSTTSINGSLFLSLYRGPIDQDSLCQNLVAISNVSPAENSAIRLAASLKSREVYTLLVTTTTPMITGDYQVQITTNQEVTEVFMEDLNIVTNPDSTVDTIVSSTSFPSAPLTFSVPLNCEDDGLISSTGLQLTGNPTEQPGCGTIENLAYQEEVNQFQDCGPTFVKRTFTFDGPNGATASCVQRIILRPLSGKLQQDIWLPPANITIDCGFPHMPTDGTLPTPEETGAPFVLTVSGAYFLDEQNFCTLDAFYEDSAPTEVSETDYTFTRNWFILDWCQPQDLLMFEQRIQVGTDLCPVTMSSQIVTEDGEGVANVLVEFTASGVTDTVYTNASGSYGIPPGFEIDSTLTIEPEKDYDHLNGVSTFDIVLISKHILGVTPLSSPYQMIAADVNNSGSITTLDLIQIRKLILQVISKFPNSTSWRFINASFALDDPSNPWSGWDTTETTQSPWPKDFIGIKIGDIDNSADPSSLQPSGNVVVRDGTPFYLHTAARQLQAGQSYDLPIFAHNLRDIDGFQATLQANAAVELLGVKGGLMSADHFGPVQPNGAMAMSWVAPQEPPDGKQPLFTLQVKAKVPTELEKALHISATLLQPEAYGKDGRWSAVAFRFDASAATSDVPQLGANYPNPFRESTQVDFYLPTDSPARLSVHNAIGQLLCTVELAGKAGWNTVQLDRSLPDVATGLLHYTLEVGEHRLTKRMLRLR